MALNDSKYPNMKTYIEDIVKPSIVALRDYLKAYVDKLRKDHEQAISQLDADLQAHITNYNNPHKTKPRHIFTISAVPPTNDQGEIGDIWIEYLPQVLP